ncbi:hypothetical protein G7B40_011035 [Aetokthonos hydrillicola Thurmond2011]|jgi:hypothetical protein|uniref:Glycosyl hydrolase family 98 putative carbohydrate-binding module domain-containing protein n=1 Tax=Aetokthonos hydrillicola Thurmond2011 TaxID=2712845 RepID=A0AAP5M8V3_9CYAN|nr:hypothetical protein [Aetokthonos hydrillicola]MBO3459802.1 hypothetical protein [Aetokthonos hydrillicola CCALA 1050]MBW4584553.1 hypothetical protein [Aetokthonos hydrillicola CCALA 1050]MDR9895097.1 hypothetical protein [Aetokthonos hydrillicola Thurmond2011]
MQKTKCIVSVFFSAVLALGFVTSERKIAQAQHSSGSVSLLRARCVDSGVGSVRDQNLDISIGKAVYSSRFYLGPGSRYASITCNIKPINNDYQGFQTLNLGFGMRDNDRFSPGVQVKVYLDGKVVETRTVSPARQTSFSLNVNNISNVSIEAVCTSQSQYCDRVYFFDASLGR